MESGFISFSVEYLVGLQQELFYDRSRDIFEVWSIGWLNASL